MRIFILEDNKNRMAKFKRKLIGHKIDHTDNIEDGSNLVISNKYDLMFLDHDLGGEEMVDSFANNTGYKLAEFISSFSINKDTPCVVHSCNPAGANNMMRVLNNAMAVPFTCLDIGLAVKSVQRTREG